MGYKITPQKPFAELPDDALIRMTALVPHVIPVSVPTMHRWVKQGKFPRPLTLQPRVSGWRVGAVRQWLKEREQG